MKRFWKFFRASPRPASHRRLRDPAVNEALLQFGKTPNLKSMHHVLIEWENVLLTEQVSFEIERAIARFEVEGDMLSSTDWRQLRAMLQDAQGNGVNEAWTRFIRQQYIARLALKALIGATSEEKRHAALKVWQQDLISDAAIVQLLGLRSEASEDHDPLRTDELDQLLHLLLECGERNVNVAWKHYTLHKNYIAQEIWSSQN